MSTVYRQSDYDQAYCLGVVVLGANGLSDEALRIHLGVAENTPVVEIPREEFEEVCNENP